jgi:asparagine synthase (glutamine-hydrolysing)
VPIRPQDFQLRRALDQPLQVEPTSILAYTLRSTIEQPIASETNAAMIFNGDGGDSMFGAEAVRYAATAYVCRHGLRAEALRIASAVALYTRESTWSVLHRALTALLTGAAIDPLAVNTSVSQLIRRDTLADAVPATVCAHPWFGSEGHAAWATVRRLGMLLGSPEFYDVIPPDDAPDVISPLYAQPVVETLLRIPLYRLFEGGRDRGLARRAFASDVPEPILARLWKDRAPGFHEQVVFMNRAFLREALLDGALVREGLLDRAAIAEALADRPSKNQVLPMEIMRHFDMEMWVRAWESPVLHSQQRSDVAVTC